MTSINQRSSTHSAQPSKRILRVLGLGVALILFVILSVVPCLGDPTLGAERFITNSLERDFRPHIVYNPVELEYLVVWNDYSPSRPWRVMGRRLNSLGYFIDEFIISDSSRGAIKPTAAYDSVNNRYLVTWMHDYYGDASDWDLRGRIIPAGGPNTSFPVFTINSWLSDQWDPRVSFGAGEFMVTWWNAVSSSVPDYVSAQRVTVGGHLNGGTITVSYDPVKPRRYPDIAYDPWHNQYLIVFQKRVDGSGNISGVRLNTNGQKMGYGEIDIASGVLSEERPRVATNAYGAQWAIVWQCVYPNGDTDIVSRRMWVDWSGYNHLYPQERITDSGLVEAHPSISNRPNSLDYLITWKGQKNAASRFFGIEARTLHAGGSLGNFLVIRNESLGLDSEWPHLVGTIYGWMVVWEQVSDSSQYYRNIYGRPVQTN